MAFCDQCGTELPSGAKFCAACGAQVGAGASTASATQARPAPPPSPSVQHPGEQAIASGTRGGLGWILPVLIGIAALAIAYLLLAPRPLRNNVSSGAISEDKAVPEASDADGGDRTKSDAASSAAIAREAADAAAAEARAASRTVSAPVLDSAFFSNPDGAAMRYAGPIRVAGTIATMVQPGPTPALSMEGRTRFNYMVVNFPAGYREQLALLSKGQFITVSCQSVRSLGGTTILSGCLLN
ncbi:zinc ribbon domain-containing protein [Sphingomonas jatrophae]|nr:zinc ribbon domain-containing protein [Sphingomonas jatrophae]